MISSEPQNVLLPNLVRWCCRMSQSVTRSRNCLLSSRSRSQRGLIISDYYSVYYIIWTVDSLATKHWFNFFIFFLLHSSQGHSEGSKCVFVQMISSKPPNIFEPNLVLWCVILSLSVMEKDRFACFQGHGHSNGSYDQNVIVSTMSSELLILLEVLLPNLVWWYIIISQSVLWRNWIVVVKVKVTA